MAQMRCEGMIRFSYAELLNLLPMQGYHEKIISGGARQAILAIPGQHCFQLISSHQQGIRNSLSSTPPVYIYKAHQNTSGSAVQN